MHIKVVKLYTKKAKGMNLGFERMLISGGERKEEDGMAGIHMGRCRSLSRF